LTVLEFGPVIPPDAVLVSAQFHPGDLIDFLLFIDENLANPSSSPSPKVVWP
jgi:hypothetical protein